MAKADGGELIARVMRENRVKYCFAINGGHVGNWPTKPLFKTARGAITGTSDCMTGCSKTRALAFTSSST